MKTFALILLLSAATVALAQFTFEGAPYPAMMQPSVAGGGLSSWACADADILCETFTGGTNSSGWSWASGGGTSIINSNYTADFPSGTCDGANNSSLDIERLDGSDVIATYTFSADKDSVYGLCWIKMVPGGATVPGSAAPILVLREAGSTSLLSVGNTNNASGQWKWTCSVYNQAGASVGNILGALSTNAWHKIEFMRLRNQASGGVTLKIDGVSQTLADTSTRDLQVHSMTMGTPSGSGIGWKMRYDNFKLSSTSAPSCSP